MRFHIGESVEVQQIGGQWVPCVIVAWTLKSKEHFISVQPNSVRRLGEEQTTPVAGGVDIDKLAGEMEECIAFDDDGSFCGFNHKQAENALREALQPPIGQVGEDVYVLAAELYDPNKRWPSDDDGFDDDKLVIWENLSTSVRWPEVCHFSQWTPRAFAQGIRSLDASDFKKIVLWGPVPDLNALQPQPQAPVVEVPTVEELRVAHERGWAGLENDHDQLMGALTAIQSLLQSKGGGREIYLGRV